MQIKTIPRFLNYHDVVVKSFTGSGKTLAFLIPVFEIVLRRRHKKIKNSEVLALIVSPTRFSDKRNLKFLKKNEKDKFEILLFYFKTALFL